LIPITGGLSVNPDDVTRQGVAKAEFEIDFYGTPVLPGAMFLYAHLEKTLLFGLPACVFFHRTNIFDLMLPRLLVGDEITKKDIAALGHGGLCLQCNECRYPGCLSGL
jgi:molybdopterin biosynthesis enzyme